MAKPANLHERVVFDAPTQQATGDGGTVNGWTEQFTTRAHFQWLRGGETVMAGRLEGKQPVVVTIRASAQAKAVGTGYRMRDTRTGEAYNVRSAHPKQDDRKWLELLCESGVAV